MLTTGASTLTATTTETDGDYDVDYIFNMLETNGWKAVDSTDPHYINYDSGGGGEEADYWIISGHNLNTIGASIKLQYSTDNFAADINDAFDLFAPTNDRTFFKSFTSPGPKRYWRLKIINHSAAPSIRTCIWGEETELDYATVGFDPHGQEAKAVTNLSEGGYVTGVHAQYVERRFTLRFTESDAALYTIVSVWWGGTDQGLKNFFVGWETTNHPTQIWLMRSDGKFRNPYNKSSTYRDITINLKGRKE